MIHKLLRVVAALAALVLAATVVGAQVGSSTPSSMLLTRSINAVAYTVDSGSTKIDLKASGAVPTATGEAEVEAKQGITNIAVKVKGLVSPTKQGIEFLTYVVWVVSPEGQTSNVGELLVNDRGEGKLETTSRLQTFSLFVTAEPYFAVRYPSEVLVLENELRKNTRGRVFPIAGYQLMKREQYRKRDNALALTLDLKNTPLEMYEARNAVEIARAHGAEKYAAEIYAKAEGGLKIAEANLARRGDKKETLTRARTTIQTAEDARALAVQRQDEERVAMEREAAAAKAKAVAEAKAAAEATAAKERADAEAKRQAERAAAREAQLAAEADARQAAMKAEAAAAALKAKYEADALKAREEAAKADAERARQATEQLRAQLLDQLNKILETSDTPRGLVVNMADVLFDTGKYSLRQPTREKLARLAGIILAHPALKLEVEGHTDSTGGRAVNQKLSEQRAEGVRTYLLEQGLSPDSVIAKGLADTLPVADNTTAAGRQKNRRVEIVVSGEVIGTKVGK